MSTLEAFCKGDEPIIGLAGSGMRVKLKAGCGMRDKNISLGAGSDHFRRDGIVVKLTGGDADKKRKITRII